MMEHRCSAGRRLVGDHETGEPPVALQGVAQKLAILRRRYSIHRVVRRHHRAGTTVLNRAPERRKINLLEHSAIHLYWIAVASTFADIRHEVFGCRDHAVLLEAPNERSRDARGKQRILTVGFLGAPPPRISCDVDDR